MQCQVDFEQRSLKKSSDMPYDAPSLCTIVIGIFICNLICIILIYVYFMNGYL